MRVISGKARGISLQSLEGMTTRPTIDRVKEALFSAIQFHIPQGTALDLFAGSGALGIEALSRGAAWCDFVEQNPRGMEQVMANLQKTKLSHLAACHKQEALCYLEQCQTKYDLVLLDPPYHQQLCDKASNALFAQGLLKPGGIIVCETAKGEAIASPFVPFKQAVYGSVQLTFFKGENP